MMNLKVSALALIARVVLVASMAAQTSSDSGATAAVAPGPMLQPRPGMISMRVEQ